MVVGKQRDRTPGNDKIIERAQRRGPVHPVEGPAHRHEIEGTEIGREVVGTPRPEMDDDPGTGGLGARALQHGLVGIDPHDVIPPPRESHREEPRPAPEIQDPAPR